MGSWLIYAVLDVPQMFGQIVDKKRAELQYVHCFLLSLLVKTGHFCSSVLDLPQCRTQ